MSSEDSGRDASEMAIGKIPTRVRGLDDVLHGGIPAGQTTLVSGGPGSGKTMLGLEILYRAALAGEPGIMVSFEESADAIRRNSASLGWDLTALEASGMLRILDGRVDPQVVRAGDFDIHGLLAILGGQSEAMGATLVMIDAIDGLLRFLDDPRREREQLEILHRWLIDQQLTSLLTVKTSDSGDRSNYEFLDYMVDCVISLDQRVNGQLSTRRLRVLKYRGSAFERNEHPFAIVEDGLRLVPVSGVELIHQTSDRLFGTGNEKIDEMLGGGLVEASVTLISGASGTGKTSLASTIAREACSNGWRVLYLQFEEAGPTMVQRMLSPGIDLRPALESGLLRIHAAMPEAMGIEEHLIRILTKIDEHKPQLLIIDAISAVGRMSTEEAAYDFLVRLANACRRSGISSVLTNQIRRISGSDRISALGISSIIDTVIFLDYEDDRNMLHKTLLVLKSRGMNHSNKRHRFRITDDGLQVEAGEDDPGERVGGCSQ